MFSFISLNWKGQPLVSYETVVNLISGTRTRTGLRVTARLDRTRYEKGVAIPDAEMASLSLRSASCSPTVELYNHSSHPYLEMTNLLCGKALAAVPGGSS